MDLIGPLITSLLGNKYVLNIMDHCTGWVESYPLPNKSNKSVWDTCPQKILTPTWHL